MAQILQFFSKIAIFIYEDSNRFDMILDASQLKKQLLTWLHAYLNVHSTL